MLAQAISGFCQSSVSEPPLYEGGTHAFYNDLSHDITLKHWRDCQINRYVYASIALNREGKIDSVWIKNAFYDDCKELLTQALKDNDNWLPTLNHDTAVRCTLRLPIGKFDYTPYARENRVRRFFKDTLSNNFWMEPFITKGEPKRSVDSISVISSDEVKVIASILGTVDNSTLKLHYEEKNQGTAELMNGNYEEAIYHYYWALRGLPEDAEIYFNRAIAFLKIDQQRLACSDWIRAAKLGDEEANNIVQQRCK